MDIHGLDHVNLRTSSLGRLTKFYVEVLGMREGPRPAFDFGGAWLYLGDHACVHLVEVTEHERPGEDLGLSHFAFRANGLTELTERLNRYQVSYRMIRPPGTSITQVHFCDPDGNALHIDFAADEQPS